MPEQPIKTFRLYFQPVKRDLILLNPRLKMHYVDAIKSFTLKFKVQQDLWVASLVTMYKQNIKKGFNASVTY